MSLRTRLSAAGDREAPPLCAGNCTYNGACVQPGVCKCFQGVLGCLSLPELSARRAGAGLEGGGGRGGDLAGTLWAAYLWRDHSVGCTLLQDTAARSARGLWAICRLGMR